MTPEGIGRPAPAGDSAVQEATSAGAMFLDLRHIRKEFGDFTALHDINLGIRKGEFV